MKPRTTDKRRFNLDKINAPDYIPYLSGRPERETVIGRNDFSNLKIALHTTEDVMDFIKNA